jgi:hypothetical protein
MQRQFQCGDWVVVSATKKLGVVALSRYGYYKVVMRHSKSLYARGGELQFVNMTASDAVHMQTEQKARAMYQADQAAKEVVRRRRFASESPVPRMRQTQSNSERRLIEFAPRAPIAELGWLGWMVHTGKCAAVC